MCKWICNGDRRQGLFFHWQCNYYEFEIDCLWEALGDVIGLVEDASREPWKDSESDHRPTDLEIATRMGPKSNQGL